MNTSVPALTIENIRENLQRFGPYDYLVFAVTLLICGFIGLFYGYRSRRTKAEDVAAEYLVGNRNMPFLPTALSLFASFSSGISMLGHPTEVYEYGTSYIFFALGVVAATLFSGALFLPVYSDLKLSSTYEFLGKRFNKKVRLLGAVLYIISNVSYLPLAIYVPALGINQVTNADINIITPAVCVVCIFYTTLGGLKAVIWTDVLQTVMMFGAVLLIDAKGTADVGGFNAVWEISREGERLENPSLDFDPTIRHSIWSVSLGGGAFFLLLTGVSQNYVQRYMALPTLSLARWALFVFTIGTVLFIILTGYAGLVAYANYADCDPLTTNLINAKDQLLPLLVMKSLGAYPGLPGIFVAGLFSASLSTLSTALNAMSAVVLEDFVKPFTTRDLSSRVTSFIMKSVALLTGMICLGLVFLVARLGTVSQLAMTLMSIANGPLLGIFCGGMLVPWINSEGTFYGALAGLAINSAVIIGAQNAKTSGRLVYPTKPTSVEACHYLHNATTPPDLYPGVLPDDVFPLYKMSYMLYTIFGALVTLVLAFVISYITGLTDLKTLNPKYVSPPVRRFLPHSDWLQGHKVEELEDLCPKNGQLKNVIVLLEGNA